MATILKEGYTLEYVNLFLQIQNVGEINEGR